MTFVSTPESRQLTFKWLCIVGICLAYIGLLIFSQALVVSGALNAERLQFTFQYANAAAIFFLIIAVLCLSSSHPIIRAGWTIPMLAILETQSIAAIVLSLLCVVAFCAWDVKERAYGRANFTCLGFIVALCLFICCKALPAGLGLVGVLIATFAWAGLFELSKSIADFKDGVEHPKPNNARAKKGTKRNGKGRKKDSKQPGANKRQASLSAMLESPKLLVCFTIFVIVAVAVFAVLNIDRVAQASQTITERVIQICDAMTLVVSNPLLGVGPGNWQYVYPDVQSAQYEATVVHCSYEKIAVDAGLLAMLVFVAFCVCGIKVHIDSVKLTRTDPVCHRFEVGVLLASLALLVHMLVDFDLDFSALLILLVLCLSPWSEGAADEGKTSPVSPISIAVVSVLCGLVSIVALWGQTAVGELERCADDGDANRAQAIISENPLVANDFSGQTYLLKSLVKSGQYEQAISVCSNQNKLIPAQQLELAEAKFNAGRKSEAEDILVSLYTKYPYQLSIFSQVRKIAAMYDESFLTNERYLAAVSRANELAHTGKGAWLNNQKDVGLLNE